MNQNEIIEKLREPFTSKEIEWKIQVTTQDKTPEKVRGMVVPYIDSRAIQKRLDEAAGAFNWRNEYSMWHEKSQICGISIFFEDRGEWVTKCDGAECSDIEPVKGGLSDAFKRAAVLWGIGRYLYELDGIWVEIEAKGKSYDIRDNQKSKLEKAYNDAVARIFNNAGTTVNTGEKSFSTLSSATQQPTNDSDFPDGTYKVHSVKPSGKESQYVELVDNNGELTSAYIKNSDNAVKAGINLKNVKIENKTSQHGPYNLINSYELAA